MSVSLDFWPYISTVPAREHRIAVLSHVLLRSRSTGPDNSSADRFACEELEVPKLRQLQTEKFRECGVSGEIRRVLQPIKREVFEVIKVYKPVKVRFYSQNKDCNQQNKTPIADYPYCDDWVTKKTQKTV